VRTSKFQEKNNIKNKIKTKRINKLEVKTFSSPTLWNNVLFEAGNFLSDTRLKMAQTNQTLTKSCHLLGETREKSEEENKLDVPT
jgi:hypothetical protein